MNDLEERKLRDAEEKKQLDKKIYAERKKKFIDRSKAQISALQTLIQARKIAFDVIKQFDGKVLNNRLTKVVEQELRKVDSHLYVTLTISYNSLLKNNAGVLEIEVSKQVESVRDGDSITIVLSPFTEGNRVMFDQTESENSKGKECLTNKIRDYQDAIKSYDQSYKAAVKLNEMIEKYGQDINYYLREYFRGFNLINKTFYC